MKALLKRELKEMRRLNRFFKARGPLYRKGASSKYTKALELSTFSHFLIFFYLFFFFFIDPKL